MYVILALEIMYNIMIIKIKKNDINFVWGNKTFYSYFWNILDQPSFIWHIFKVWDYPFSIFQLVTHLLPFSSY